LARSTGEGESEREAGGRLRGGGGHGPPNMCSPGREGRGCSEKGGGGGRGGHACTASEEAGARRSQKGAGPRRARPFHASLFVDATTRACGGTAARAARGAPSRGRRRCRRTTTSRSPSR